MPLPLVILYTNADWQQSFSFTGLFVFILTQSDSQHVTKIPPGKKRKMCANITKITTSLAQRQKWNAKLVWSRRTPSAWILVHQITTHVIKKQSWWSSLKLQTVSVAFECLYAAVTCVLKVAHDINEKQTAVWIYGSCYFSPMFLTVMNTKGRKLWQTALTHPLC